MKKFIAILKIENDSNDAVSTIHFEAENAVEAGRKLKEIIFKMYISNDSTLSAVTYYEINNTYEADIKRWYAEFDQIREMAARENEKKKDIAEYERIKQKYNL